MVFKRLLSQLNKLMLILLYQAIKTKNKYFKAFSNIKSFIVELYDFGLIAPFPRPAGTT